MLLDVSAQGVNRGLRLQRISAYGDEGSKAAHYGRLTGLVIDAVRETKIKMESANKRITTLGACGAS
jgi:hypothetical protein